jgi:hypothetical protein
VSEERRGLIKDTLNAAGYRAPKALIDALEPIVVDNRCRACGIVPEEMAKEKE